MNKIPFSLELYKQGHKVYSKDRDREVRDLHVYNDYDGDTDTTITYVTGMEYIDESHYTSMFFKPDRLYHLEQDMFVNVYQNKYGKLSTNHTPYYTLNGAIDDVTTDRDHTHIGTFKLTRV